MNYNEYIYIHWTLGFKEMSLFEYLNIRYILMNKLRHTLEFPLQHLSEQLLLLLLLWIKF